MDGVPMVTQCPIPSSTTFQYKFRASRAGTHMWHAHTGVHLTDGIFGALIVRQPAKREPHLKQYDVDDPSHVIVINEWNHGFAIQRLLEPKPSIGTASLLINGRSQPKKLGGSEGPDPPLSSFTVAPGKRYRFRLAYAGGGRACPITVSIANHVLSVISLDGNPIIPHEVTSFVMAAGERADFVLTADQPVANYWLHVNTIEDCDTSTIEGAAILRYHGAPESSEPFAPKPSDVEHTSHSLTLLNTVDGQCTASKSKDTLCLSDVKALNKMQRELAEKKVDITLYLAFGFKQLSGENSASPSDQGANRVTRKLVPHLNNFTFVFPSSPLLTQAEDVIPDLMCQQEKLPPRCQSSPICECVHVIDVPLGATVELILVDQGGSDSGHVFHLHGYSFYVVGVTQLDQPTALTDIQELDSRDSLLPRNLVNPVLKDTVTVPSNGVSVLRFKADNPGYWLLHDQHVSYWTNGFDVILHVGQPNDVPPTPKDFPRCGNWVGPEYFLT